MKTNKRIKKFFGRRRTYTEEVNFGLFPANFAQEPEQQAKVENIDLKFVRHLLRKEARKGKDLLEDDKYWQLGGSDNSSRQGSRVYRELYGSEASQDQSPLPPKGKGRESITSDSLVSSPAPSSPTKERGR